VAPVSVFKTLLTATDVRQQCKMNALLKHPRQKWVREGASMLRCTYLVYVYIVFRTFSAFSWICELGIPTSNICETLYVSKKFQILCIYNEWTIFPAS